MTDGSNSLPSGFQVGSSVPYSAFEAAKSKAERLSLAHQQALLGDANADMPSQVALDFIRWKFVRVISLDPPRLEFTKRGAEIRMALQAAQ